MAGSRSGKGTPPSTGKTPPKKSSADASVTRPTTPTPGARSASPRPNDSMQPETPSSSGILPPKDIRRSSSIADHVSVLSSHRSNSGGSVGALNPDASPTMLLDADHCFYNAEYRLALMSFLADPTVSDLILSAMRERDPAAAQAIMEKVHQYYLVNFLPAFKVKKQSLENRDQFENEINDHLVDLEALALRVEGLEERNRFKSYSNVTLGRLLAYEMVKFLYAAKSPIMEYLVRDNTESLVEYLRSYMLEGDIASIAFKIGSQRQSVKNDHFNAALFTTGLIFQDAEVLVRYLNDECQIPAKLIKTTMADIHSGLELGATYEKALVGDARNDHYHYDSEKLPIVYLEAHERKLAYPDRRVIVQLLDDSSRIFASLKEIFSAHPELLPKDTVLELVRFDGDFHVTHTVHGTGEVDPNYRVNLLRMARRAATFKTSSVIDVFTKEAVAEFIANRNMSDLEISQRDKKARRQLEKQWMAEFVEKYKAETKEAHTKALAEAVMRSTAQSAEAPATQAPATQAPAVQAPANTAVVTSAAPEPTPAAAPPRTESPVATPSVTRAAYESRVSSPTLPPSRSGSSSADLKTSGSLPKSAATPATSRVMSPGASRPTSPGLWSGPGSRPVSPMPAGELPANPFAPPPAPLPKTAHSPTGVFAGVRPVVVDEYKEPSSVNSGFNPQIVTEYTQDRTRPKNEVKPIEPKELQEDDFNMMENNPGPAQPPAAPKPAAAPTASLPSVDDAASAIVGGVKSLTSWFRK